MKIHILPGDALVETFKKTNIEGEIAVCRECLIDGDLSAENLEDFWRVRENYLSEAYPEGETSYGKKVKSEFEKLLDAPKNAGINLWFEYELFCQANMWFCLYLLEKSEAEIYRVEPIVRNEKDIWNGFGGLSKDDLQKCFDARKKFTREDVKLGADLWKAFQNKDFNHLKNLAQTESKCFPQLEEVCRAAIEKQNRPKEIVRKIISEGERDFGKVFSKFKETEGVYGFGDLQVKRIYDEILS
jgi:hypothetical protein